MRDRYSIVVGLLFAAIVLIAVLNGGGNGGTLGLDRQPPRWPLPEFAVPVAASRLEGDANVAQSDCSSSQLPCPAGARQTPACRVRGASVIRVCDLFDRPLVLSFWFSRGGGDCVNQQDVVDAAYARYRGRVNFLSLDVLDGRESVRQLVRQHRWRMPVGYDRDGAVGALYRVGGCPTFAYVYPGGTLQDAGIGNLTLGQLSGRIKELLRATRVVRSEGA
ncbi:MAG: hypothetical protein WBM00_12380 [Solirubrobacterales bacterium]